MTDTVLLFSPVLWCCVDVDATLEERKKEERKRGGSILLHFVQLCSVSVICAFKCMAYNNYDWYSRNFVLFSQLKDCLKWHTREGRVIYTWYGWKYWYKVQDSIEQMWAEKWALCHYLTWMIDRSDGRCWLWHTSRVWCGWRSYWMDGL